MENRKKAIILDMDETLEHGIFQSKYDIGNGLKMILRPHLDELITKLHEAKKQGIDIVLCTTATEKWVERFFKLKPEIKELFDKILTRNNEEEWKNFSEEKYPLEYKARNENINLEYLKPVTTFGYDSVLYIDDNKLEGVRLQILFGITHGKLEKDVTYFSGFGFNGGRIACEEMLAYKKLAKQNIEFFEKLEEYIETEKNNPGCIMMCSAIDKFMKKSLSLVYMEVNEIRITTGFALLKDIIHIYAPIYYEEKEPIEKLREGYLKLLDVIKREEYKSVIIPSLGTGFHGYQHEEVAEMVIKLLKDFCKNNEIEIVFNLYDDETKQIYEQYLKQ